MAPAAMASHHIGPPDETGLGGADVSDEPNHQDDQDLSTNGLKDCNPGCDDPTGTLLLEGTYANGQYPYFVDLNNIVRQATSEAPGVEHTDYMYPGQAFMAAWYGWWFDKGRGGSLQETGQTIPEVSSGSPDGVINDGHDNHEAHGDSEYTGPWDEFVWRGQNPWAPQDKWDAKLGGKPSVPSDSMYAFIHPGTTDTGSPFNPDGLLEDDADHPDRPDFTMDDRTSQAVTSPGPYPHNNQAYGWLAEGGWWHYQYDQSLLMATQIKYSANPDPAPSAPGTGFKPDSGDLVDTDGYAALHPALETAYRTAVWDPGDEAGTPGEDVVHQEGEGIKERVKDVYSATSTAGVMDAYYDATSPIGPVLGQTGGPVAGANGDAYGSNAWPHEPSTGDDVFPGANHDGDKSYGMLNGQSSDYYENPDRDQDYAAHKTGFVPWLDAQAEVAGAQYNVQIRGYDSYNVFPTPNDGDASDRTAVPSAIWIGAHLGAWQDHDGDEFIGNLEELGRPTSEDNPYADGRVDDPHDYEDNPTTTESTPDNIKTPPSEWRGVAEGATTVTATLEPVGTPTNDKGDHAWGNTQPPAGVYVIRDHDSNNFNPYDDMVEDACGCGPGVGDFQGDEDGEQLSQYVQYGAVTVAFSPNTQDDEGLFLMEENVVLPTGSLNFPVKITTDGEITGKKFKSLGGDDLTGDTVTDVDILEPSAVTG